MTSQVDVKVVLLGREFSGKTSLVERFLNDRFSGDHRYQNTIGAAFGAKKIDVEGVGEVVLGIWDTAGSERYEAMTRMYYRSAKAAILCYDVTNEESWKRIPYYIEELRKTEKYCKVYVCGNKVDLLRGDNRLRAVDYHNALEYAEQEGMTMVETSSKSGHNVDELFQIVALDYLADPRNSHADVGNVSLDSVPEKSKCCFA